MTKKKKKVRPHQGTRALPPKDPQQQKELPRWAEKLKPPEDLTPEQRGQAIGRLKSLFEALSAPSETVIQMLDRLEIPWEVRTFSESKSVGIVGKYLLVKTEDLEAGEERNEQLLKRIYKDNTRIVPLEEIEKANEDASVDSSP